MKYLPTKVVVSIGLGGRVSEIEAVKAHAEKIFNSIANQKFCITRCRKSNSLFKIRKNAPLGLKMTLRRDAMRKAVKLFNFEKNAKYDRTVASVGISSHRNLKLETFDPRAPEYGFNATLIYERMGSRVVHRRINPKKLRPEKNKMFDFFNVEKAC